MRQCFTAEIWQSACSTVRSLILCVVLENQGTLRDQYKQAPLPLQMSIRITQNSTVEFTVDRPTFKKWWPSETGCHSIVRTHWQICLCLSFPGISYTWDKFINVAGEYVEKYVVPTPWNLISYFVNSKVLVWLERTLCSCPGDLVYSIFCLRKASSTSVMRLPGSVILPDSTYYLGDHEDTSRNQWFSKNDQLQAWREPVIDTETTQLSRADEVDRGLY